jgi:hypothetical protein
MTLVEANKLWTLGASTGVSTDPVYLAGLCQKVNVYFQTDGASTASLEMMTSRTSTGPWVSMGSSQSLSTGQTIVIGFDGPVLYMAPRLIAINSTANQVFVTLVAAS